LKSRSAKTLAQRRSTAEFIERVPEKAKDIPVELMKQIRQKPLNDYTIEELENIATEVEKLIKQGKLRRKLQQKPIIEERKQTIEQLQENTEQVTPSRVKDGPQDLANEQGLLRTAFDKIKAWTWIPQTLFDMLDGGKNFTGRWFQVFYRDTKDAKAKAMKKNQARTKRFHAKVNSLNLSAWHLSGSRMVGDKSIPIQNLMGVYLASKNVLSKLVLRYGHEMSDADIKQRIDALTAEEKELADWMAGEFEDNYSHLRRSVIEQENRDMGREENYWPIRRTGDTKALQQEVLEATLRREQIRRHNTAHGFTMPRVNVPAELQTTMRLDAINVWFDQMNKQERYIEIGPQVRRMNKIMANKSLRKTIIEHFGQPIIKALDGYVASVANPYIYKQHNDIERASAYLRKNSALAYLGFNLVTMGKQLPSVLLYLADAGPSHLLASAIDFAQHPLEIIDKVRSLDPETADRSLERELQELRDSPNANYIRQKIGHYGMEGIFLFDTIARTIGWNAVYERALAVDKSKAEAINLAREATLRTQPAAAAEDIPALYRTNEILNWFTMFTNQLNKIFNIASYDIPSYIQNKQYADAALQTMGMSIVALVIWMVTNRKWPEEPKDFIEAISEQAINMLPAIGKPIMAARKGWDSDIPAFEGARAIGVALTSLEDLEFTRNDTKKIAEGIAVTTGIPYTAVRRAVQAIEYEQPTALLGARRPKTARRGRRTSKRR
jgi:PAS domain-containing protein